MNCPLLSDLIYLQAKAKGDAAALRIRKQSTKTWHSISWNDFASTVDDTANALCSWGIKETDKIGLFAQNMEHCLYMDFAAFANRAIMVPMYATSSAAQIKYIVQEAEIKLLVVGEQYQYDTAWEVLQNSQTLQQIVIVDKLVVKKTEDASSIFWDEFISPENIKTSIGIEVERRRKSATEDDVAHLIYTSGTTGEPKGVIMRHSNYMEATRTHRERLNYLPKDFVSMSFLPLTHIFEKVWAIHCLYIGATIAINHDPKMIQETIKEVQPNALCSVPRFWEKIYTAVQAKIASSSPLLRKVFAAAIETGREYRFDYINEGKKVPWILERKFKFYDKIIFKALRKNIGIDNGIIFPCAGAALSDKINQFMLSVNIPLVYGYGLTETTATVTCFPQTGFELGSVGTLIPGYEIKIGEQNEIIVRGKAVMHGYYKKPKETADVLSSDGWFKTGDAGYLKGDKLFLTERIKDLYKTSNGKYIAPQQIETCLSEDQFIDMIAAIGDQKKFVSALIVPNYPQVEQYAQLHKITFANREELCNNSQIYQLFEGRIQAMHKDFAPYEQIKKIHILSEPFSIENGELTNTLKMRRAFILNKYEAQINAMYKE